MGGPRRTLCNFQVCTRRPVTPICTTLVVYGEVGVKDGREGNESHEVVGKEESQRVHV